LESGEEVTAGLWHLSGFEYHVVACAYWLVAAMDKPLAYVDYEETDL